MSRFVVGAPTGGLARPARALAGLGLVAAGLVGCRHRPDDPAPVPVSGVVIYKNKPLETGRIVFVPERGRPAEGTIEDGRFVLSTARAGDGARPGRHRVGVVATKEIPSGEGDGRAVRSLIPEDYAHPLTSRVEVVVPEKGLKDFEIRLP